MTTPHRPRIKGPLPPRSLLPACEVHHELVTPGDAPPPLLSFWLHSPSREPTIPFCPGYQCMVTVDSASFVCEIGLSRDHLYPTFAVEKSLDVGPEGRQDQGQDGQEGGGGRGAVGEQGEGPFALSPEAAWARVLGSTAAVDALALFGLRDKELVRKVRAVAGPAPGRGLGPVLPDGSLDRASVNKRRSLIMAAITRREEELAKRPRTESPVPCTVLVNNDGEDDEGKREAVAEEDLADLGGVAAAVAVAGADDLAAPLSPSIAIPLGPVLAVPATVTTETEIVVQPSAPAESEAEEMQLINSPLGGVELSETEDDGPAAAPAAREAKAKESDEEGGGAEEEEQEEEQEEGEDGDKGLFSGPGSQSTINKNSQPLFFSQDALFRGTNQSAVSSSLGEALAHTDAVLESKARAAAPLPVPTELTNPLTRLRALQVRTQLALQGGAPILGIALAHDSLRMCVRTGAAREVAPNPATGAATMASSQTSGPPTEKCIVFVNDLLHVSDEDGEDENLELDIPADHCRWDGPCAFAPGDGMILCISPGGSLRAFMLGSSPSQPGAVFLDFDSSAHGGAAITHLLVVDHVTLLSADEDGVLVRWTMNPDWGSAVSYARLPSTGAAGPVGGLAHVPGKPDLVLGTQGGEVVMWRLGPHSSKAMLFKDAARGLAEGPEGGVLRAVAFASGSATQEPSACSVMLVRTGTTAPPPPPRFLVLDTDAGCVSHVIAEGTEVFAGQPQVITDITSNGSYVFPGMSTIDRKCTVLSVFKASLRREQAVCPIDAVGGEINCIVCHPTLPFIAVGCSDGLLVLLESAVDPTHANANA
jgi:hypothetical protein